MNVTVFVFTPVASCKSSLQTVSDDVVLDCLLKQNLVVTIIDVFLQNFRHNIGEVSKDLSKIATE